MSCQRVGQQKESVDRGSCFSGTTFDSKVLNIQSPARVMAAAQKSHP